MQPDPESEHYYSLLKDDAPVDNDDDQTMRERFHRWSVTELLNSDLTYRWHAEGFLVEPTYGMDSGELKTLKSIFGLARAVGLAAGVPILGRWRVPERQRVLVYVAEGGRIPYTRRLIRMCEAHGVDPRDLDGWLEPIFDAGPLDSDTFRTTLRNHLDEFAPAFVHLDPLYPFQPMTVSSNQLSQVGAMLNETQGLCAERNATLWITAHMNQTGNGFDLKRVSGAGVGEWGDSWCLLRHRETPDVAAGRFRLALDVGSRQWGGGTFDLDFNIGRFDPETGSHDGPLTFKTAPAGPAERTDKTVAKVSEAKLEVLRAVRRSRKPLSVNEINERTAVAGKPVRVAIHQLIDDGSLLEDTAPNPKPGARGAAAQISVYRAAPHLLLDDSE